MPNPYEAPCCQETDSPYERISGFFSAGLVPAQSTCSRVFWLHFCQRAQTVRVCTKHLLRFYRRRDDDCRATVSYPLRPRNISVPSCRPTQKGGCTFPMRQLVPGSGEGQHTSTVCDSRRLSRSGGGVQSIAQGQDKAPMCSWAFADAGRQHCRARSPGSSYGDPVRPQARPLPSLNRGGTSPYRTPSLV